ncbi:MAG: CRTAC1 family protein [Thermoanaerobaculia bacterium]|nr:CRTAC1 family protein [Thermoanaerobaculia bacterium]
MTSTEEPRKPDQASEEELHDHEFVPEDDEIIARAFRRSLLVIGAVALLVLLAVYLLRPATDPGEETSLATEAPREVVREEITPPRLTFVDVTQPAGIDFTHESGAAGDKLLPETMGSGVAFLDLDEDGDPDLLFSNGARWPEDGGGSSGPKLYRNDSTADGIAFADVTGPSGLDQILKETSFYGTGLAVGDADGDGLPDVFLASVGGNRLLRNEGELTFADVTTAAGVAGDADTWSTSAAFVDVDNDGDLDLFVCNYVVWSRQIDTDVDYRLTGVGRAYGPPVNYQGTQPYLYRNEGDGTFVDISAEAGIEVVNDATGVAVGKGLGVAPIDIDADGWIDLMVANDTVQNFLFHNQGNGTFSESAQTYGLAYGRQGEATGAMGVDAAHYRNDRELGFAIGNFANEMTSLYISQGDPTLYADEAITDGIGAPSRTLLTFGTLFLDVDLDGRLDLLQTNGHLENEIGTVDPSQTYEQRSQLFWNAGPDHRQTFLEIAPENGGDLARTLVGRSSAVADADGDGDLDVVLTQIGRPALLLRNDQASGHHWLRVRLQDPTSANRHALGAWVEITADGQTQRRSVVATRSYQSQSDPAVTFGLGPATSIEAATVIWPGGYRQELDPSDWNVDSIRVVTRSDS